MNDHRVDVSAVLREVAIAGVGVLVGSDAWVEWVSSSSKKHLGARKPVTARGSLLSAHGAEVPRPKIAALTAAHRC